MGLASELPFLPFVRVPHVFSRCVYGAALPLSEARSDLIAIPKDLLAAVDRRRNEFIAGRLCAARALLLMDSIQLNVGRDRFGAPQWPEGVTGSITHTNTTAYAVVADNRDGLHIGIDSEPILPHAALIDVLMVCCNCDERVSLRRNQDLRLAATLAFSAKESFIKVVSSSLGRFVEFEEVIINVIDWNKREIEIAPSAHLGIRQCVASFSVDNQSVHTSISITVR